MSHLQNRALKILGFSIALIVMSWGIAIAFREGMQFVAIVILYIALAVILGINFHYPEKTKLYRNFTLITLFSWIIGVFGFVVSSISVELIGLPVIQRLGIYVFLASMAFAGYWFFHFPLLGISLIFLKEDLDERRSK